MYNRAATLRPDTRLNPSASCTSSRARAPLPVLAWRGIGGALHLALGIAMVAVVYPFVPPRRRGLLRQRWSRALLRRLGVELRAEGMPIAPGCVVVANHVSWLDIFVIDALAPAAFVSKAEVRRWPLFGWLAARNETVFLRRGSRGHAKIINREIAALLDAGRNVAVFPEGMTTDGTAVLHFHAALLQPAIEAGRAIQPVAISYERADGSRTTAPAFVGDIGLHGSLAAIVSEPKLVARTVAIARLATDAGGNRRELAATARDAIVAALAAVPTPASRSPDAGRR